MYDELTQYSTELELKMHFAFFLTKKIDFISSTELHVYHEIWTYVVHNTHTATSTPHKPTKQNPVKALALTNSFWVKSLWLV